MGGACSTHGRGSSFSCKTEINRSLGASARGWEGKLGAAVRWHSGVLLRPQW
jgi:hypothetical protein